MGGAWHPSQEGERNRFEVPIFVTDDSREKSNTCMASFREEDPMAASCQGIPISELGWSCVREESSARSGAFFEIDLRLVGEGWSNR